jgi:tagatose-1,6-bisphosphate aldolase
MRQKKVASCASPIPVDEELSIPMVEDPLIVSDESAIVVAADVDSLEHDPSLRSSISTFDVNEQDSIRRRYIVKGPCHLYAYNLVNL